MVLVLDASINVVLVFDYDQIATDLLLIAKSPFLAFRHD